MKAKVIVFIIVVALSISMAHADTLKILDDGTAYVKGKVIEHTSGCEVDGACSLIVRVNGQKVVLVYAEGDFECINTQAASWVNWGKNVENGTVIKAYGAYTKQRDTYRLAFCNSKDYFILGENDPLPGGVYTKKFVDKEMVTEESPKMILPDYKVLAKECKKKLSVECCLASVRAMELGQYLLDTGKTFGETTCPDGFQPNMMRCPDSYRWCIPAVSK